MNLGADGAVDKLAIAVAGTPEINAQAGEAMSANWRAMIT